MDSDSKEALMEEAPPRYSAAPPPPCVPQQLRWLLGVALAAGLGVAVVACVLLLGLHLAEAHAETVLRMSIGGLRGDGPAQQLTVSSRERTGTFAVRDGLNSSAMLVYDYSKLLISYRSWRHPACYVTRMARDSVQGLDAVTAAFRHRQAEQQESGVPGEPLGDRSLLGTTANVLCSTVPVYWA
ncbi:pulmonary surfactant-associated protein C [Nothoprocta perdicaria]|uniref:pulmonary surfactant-associated protein C n=1 Tax=Nothoprocta perdicaria TaxID=30464 RepID=UPI000E1BB295|nr:pulmonary surfactant-associated protein C [Nothoprocta perdicaria]